MSKDTLEVGDVWVNPYGNKSYIIGTQGDLVYCITDCRGGIACTYLKGDFNHYNTYLGKSKANIDDLFKTENNNDNR